MSSTKTTRFFHRPTYPTQVSTYEILQSLQFNLFLPPAGDLIINCGQNFRKTNCFADTVLSLMRRTLLLEKILIVVLVSTVDFLQKSDRSTENGIKLPDPVKNPSAFPATINLTVLLMSSIALISFRTRTISGTWFHQLLYHSSTLMIDSLCPISTRNQKLTNLEQTHIWRSLHCERWAVKGRDCASALHYFKEITYRTDERTRQLLRLRSWVISANPEQWMEFRALWWTVNAFKCRYLFHLFDFNCLLV